MAQRGHSGRDIAIGVESASGITQVSAAYTVLPSDRVINLTGSGTYTVTLCPPSVFPAGQILVIRKAGASGEVTVSTPSGGIFATALFTVDGLTGIDDYKILLNTGFDWLELKELTT